MQKDLLGCLLKLELYHSSSRYDVSMESFVLNRNFENTFAFIYVYISFDFDIISVIGISNQIFHLIFAKQLIEVAYLSDQ